MRQHNLFCVDAIATACNNRYYARLLATNPPLCAPLRSLPSRQRPFFYFQTDSYLSLTRLMPLHSNRYYVHFVPYKSARVYQVAPVEHQNSTGYFLHFHSFRCKYARSHSTVILPRRRMSERQRKRVRQERPLVRPRRN